MEKEELRDNERLKSELLHVIAQMEEQLLRLNQKRTERIEAEREEERRFVSRLSKIKVGTRKANALNDTIALMNRELEYTHDNSK